MPFPLRPALSALCSFVLSGLFAGVALLRDGVRGELRTLWWALSVLWLLLAIHYLRRTASGRARHPAPAPTSDEDPSTASGVTDAAATDPTDR